MITAATFHGGSRARNVSASFQLGAFSERVQILNVTVASRTLSLPNARNLRTGGIHFIIANIGEETLILSTFAGKDELPSIEGSKVAICCLVGNADTDGAWVVKIGDLNSSDDPAQTEYFYKFGGRTGTTVPLADTVLRFNVLLDSWETLNNNINAQRWEGIVFAVANKAYISQSFNGLTPRDEVWEYDAEVWTQRGDMNSGDGDMGGRGGASRGVGTKGYSVAGSITSFQKRTLEYTPGSDAWVRLADYPSSSAVHTRHVTVTDGTDLYMLGGRSDGGGGPSATNGYRKYTIGTDTYSGSIADAPTVPRLDAGAFWFGAYGYFVGGGTNTTNGDAFTVDRLDRFDPAGTWTWVQMTDLNRLARQTGAAVTSDTPLITGGRAGDAAGYDNTESYNVAGDAWVVQGAMPSPRWGINNQCVTLGTT